MSRRVVGFYHNQKDAQEARDELLQSGYDSRRVSMFSGTDQPTLWDEIKMYFHFASARDRDLYRDAARRGSVAVLVDMLDEEVPQDEQAMDILERHNPIDLEAQARGWGSTGAEGYGGPVPPPLTADEGARRSRAGGPRPGAEAQWSTSGPEKDTRPGHDPAAGPELSPEEQAAKVVRGTLRVHRTTDPL